MSPARTRSSLHAVDPGALSLDSILRSMPIGEVMCRSGRHRYGLDETLPGQAWPDTVRAWPADGGAYRIEDACLLCGLAWRVFYTGPNGELDPWAPYSTHYDRDWVSIPQEYDRTKAMLRSEKYRRAGRGVAAQLRRVAARTLAEDRKQDRGQAPAARFSHGAG
jgi:hypothetical protein